MKRSIASTAIILWMLGWGAIAAQTQNQQPPSQQPSPSGGSMEGMGMMHGAMDKSDVVAIPAGTLRITFGEKTADWTLAKLGPLAHVSATVPNEHTKSSDTYSGVPLMDLLTPLGVPTGPHGGAMKIYLVAEGSDGYKAVFSLAEVNPAMQDATVIVTDTENSKPLTTDGPLKLVDTHDKHPARGVRNLVAVKVMTAQ